MSDRSNCPICRDDGKEAPRTGCIKCENGKRVSKKEACGPDDKSSYPTSNVRFINQATNNNLVSQTGQDPARDTESATNDEQKQDPGKSPVVIYASAIASVAVVCAAAAGIFFYRRSKASKAIDSVEEPQGPSTINPLYEPPEVHENPFYNRDD